MRNNTIRFVIAVIVGGLVADFIHTHVGIGVPTYGTFVQTISYLTKPEEALGMAIIYYLLGDRLPSRSWVVRGILLAAIILLADGGLVRQLLMNLLMPNTVWEALQFQSQVWLSRLVTALIITLLIKPKYEAKR
jgi:hypothetical protein